ncbi:uncharacterized protein N7511_008385 [Penicillium nucicola]|uniref:uncharacterized protein n=1 Tax=Penicillium nucicola TaxID=1850975 RepID=UPI00254585A3|nr:uncharacterized protein N7511_008385 [Penicillium nucicola]KAJ5751420.1 hypothetical protein N7511_008385 [Penicillium nucicola]
MSKNTLLRELLPRDKEFSILYLKTDSSAKQRRNVSLACTECQKKRSKCSGTNPCTTCMTESRQCLYDPARDRRRKAHTAELLNFRVALSRTVAKLRSGTPEEISSLIQEIRNLPTDQDAVNYLVHGSAAI